MGRSDDRFDDQRLQRALAENGAVCTTRTFLVVDVSIHSTMGLEATGPHLE